jgi:hypothetical protein
MALVKDYGVLHPSPIETVTITPDQCFVFTSDLQGNLKTWKMIDGELVINKGSAGKSPVLGTLQEPKRGKSMIDLNNSP